MRIEPNKDVLSEIKNRIQFLLFLMVKIKMVKDFQRKYTVFSKNTAEIPTVDIL